MKWRTSVILGCVAVCSATGVAPVRASETAVLLTDPFLQRPAPDVTEVVWFTEFAGAGHHVLAGPGVGELSEDQVRRAVAAGAPDVEVYPARTIKLSQVAEDADSRVPADRKPVTGIAAREVFRHSAAIAAPAGGRIPYRVVSTGADAFVASQVYSARGPLVAGEPAVIMLTSDHQLMVNTPANLEWAARTITAELGPIDAVFMPGDLVNVPDRASEWFDDERGSAFFPAMQGRGGRAAADGTVYHGGRIMQNAPLFPAIGNHEVQGRRAGHTSLNESFANPVPRAVAEAAFTGADADKAQWVHDNSWSTTTFEEIFSLPAGRRYYATTVGDVRLITLFATRIWRADSVEPGSATRYRENPADLTDPLAQGYGEFLFEDLGVGSDQYEWLRQELRSAEFGRARYTVVMLHEGPQSLGENAMPPFAHPQRIEDTDGSGRITDVRYEYPHTHNILVRDVGPLLEQAGVDLVYNGHSHLWNRFVSPAGVNYLEASNTGNSYGAYLSPGPHRRPVPPPPWDPGNYLAQGNPGGLAPVPPTLAARNGEPFIADNNLIVFQALHTGSGTVTSWYVDMADTAAGAVRFDEFEL